MKFETAAERWFSTIFRWHMHDFDLVSIGLQ